MLLNLTPDEVQANSDIIPELFALYVSISIKSGDSLIVGNDGQVLYADSSVGYTKHLETYKEENTYWKFQCWKIKIKKEGLELWILKKEKIM